MATLLEILLHLPLASALVWLVNAFWPWMRGLRTPPEKAFVASCLFLGLWIFFDWVVLHTGNLDLAILVSKVRMSLLTLTSVAIFYFGRWLVRPRGVVDALALLPVAGSLAIGWTVMTSGAEIVWWGPRLIRDPTWYAIWAFQVAAYFLLSFYYLGQTFRRATFASGTTQTKLIVIFVAYVAAMVSWLTTNVYNNLAQTRGFPAFSTLLLVPGLLLLVFLAPESTEVLLAAFRRMMVAPARPFAAIWYHNSGQPLAQVLLPDERPLDAAVLSDLSRAIDHVLTHGLHSEPGMLREMASGEYRFVFERGRYVTLVVLLRGRPSEALRSELRLAVRDFEVAHGSRLETWEAASEVAELALNALDEVLNPHIL